jgi:NAD-dependent SIR2 family protein deacetylase
MPLDLPAAIQVLMADPERNLKTHSSPRDASVAALQSFLDGFGKVTILSGAGCSTASGIPDYRDDGGNWKHRRPVQLAEFLSSTATRRRYWARSFAGWSRIANAEPNAAHLALAALERLDKVDCLITQNVDNLHRRAGSLNVIDLHGILHRVRCLGCGTTVARDRFQQQLADQNPDWSATVAGFAPDGDARLVASDFLDFRVPDCETCGGTLKPDVVFFGEGVPPERVELATASVRRSDALLIVGSSLMVLSGLRYARMARALDKAVIILNRGTTRADDLATTKLTDDCGSLLSSVVDRLEKERNGNGRQGNG